MIDSVFKTGSVDELQRLKDEGLLWYITISNYAGLNQLATRGNLDALKWVVSESGLSLGPQRVGTALLLHAARSGHFGVVKWLVEESGLQVDCREVSLWIKIWRFNDEIDAYLRFVQKAQDESSVKHWRRRTKPRLSL